MVHPQRHTLEVRVDILGWTKEQESYSPQLDHRASTECATDRFSLYTLK